MTIVTVGKLILQELQGHEDAYVQELCTALQGHTQECMGRCLDGVLKAEVDKWLGRDPYTRRRRSKRQKVKERCSRCLSHQRQNFRRNGCYRRDLNTGWGKSELNC